MNRYSVGTIFEQLKVLDVRHGLAVIVAFMVLSSPFYLAGEPILAASSPRDPSTLSPSTISQGGDFNTQAALQIPRTFQSTDIVSSTGIYEVTFITTTAGAIDKIEIAFPVGTNIGAAGLIESVGIGGGTLLKVGSTLTFDLTTPVNVPAGTFIRLEISGIRNPSNASPNFSASITTRDSVGTAIDGPSQTNVYAIRQIGTNDIANSAVTTSKIADNAITTFKVSTAFMKHVTLSDDASGNARGWNPNGATTAFNIDDPDIDNAAFDFVILELNDVGAPTTNAICGVTDISINGDFDMDCNIAPANGIELHYILATVQADT